MTTRSEGQKTPESFLQRLKTEAKISKICTYMKIKEYNFFHDCQQSSMFFLTPQLQDFPKVGTLI